MKHARILSKNAASLLLREFLNKGSLLIMVFFVGRALGKAGLGQYTLALAISQILFLATDLGLNTLLVRDVSKNRSEASRCLYNFGMAHFISGVATLVLVGIAGSILGCSKELYFIIYLCAFSYFIIRFTTLCESVFQAFEMMEYQFFASFIKNLIFIPSAIWYIYRIGDLKGLFYIFLFANIVTLFFALFACIRLVGFRPLRPNAAFLKEYINKAFPIWLTGLFALIYLKAATLFLYKMKGEEAVGVYNASYMIVEGFLVFSGVIASALFPLFSRFHLLSPDRLKGMYIKSLSFTMFIFLPLACLAALLADRYIPLIYGAEFENSVAAARILSFTAFLAAFGTLNSYIIITIDRQFILPFICAFGVLLNLFLNFTLIPRFSCIGASVSSVVTELAMFSTLIFMVKKYFNDIMPFGVFAKTVVAASIMCLCVYFMKPLNLFLLISLAIALYISIGYALKGFIFEERRYFKALLKPSLTANGI